MKKYVNKQFLCADCIMSLSPVISCISVLKKVLPLVVKNDEVEFGVASSCLDTTHYKHKLYLKCC